MREIEAGLADESNLKGELDDVNRKLSVFEQSGHAEILETYQKRKHQEREIEIWEERWAGLDERLRKVAEEAEQIFGDWQKKKGDSSWKTNVKKAYESYRKLEEKLADEGVGEPSAYGKLVQRRQEIEQALNVLKDRKDQLNELNMMDS